MFEKNWIKTKYYYDSLQESKISNILYFGLIWSIFEDEVCNNNAKIDSSRSLSLKLVNALDSTSKTTISKIWNYFTNRYINEDGSVKEMFTSFKFNQNDDKQFVEYALKKRKNASYEEKSEAILRIVFRLRNNLLHGEKDVSALYSQNENFKNANKFLILFIDKQIRTAQ